MNDYKNVVPPKFHHVKYETDVSEIIKATCAAQLKLKKGLFLVGDTGAGKTHVAYAIAKRMIEEGHKVRFYNTGEFLDLLRREFNNPPEDGGLFQEIMDYDGTLFFDDIGAEQPSTWVVERLYLIINKKYEQMRPMFFTTNCTKDQLVKILGDRTVSRINAMTVQVRIPGGDRRKQ